MAMNVVVTLHQPICLYSDAGGKANHQIVCTRWTVDHTTRPDRFITSEFGAVSVALVSSPSRDTLAVDRTLAILMDFYSLTKLTRLTKLTLNDEVFSWERSTESFGYG